MIVNSLKKLNIFLRSRSNSLSASVYIPFESHASIGGPSTFLKNLRSYFDRVDFPYTSSINKANVILFPISYDIRALEKFKARGGIICQRLDGVYYPEKHGDEYRKRNEKIKEIYLNFADHVIYQSEYSRAQCIDMFGEKSASDASIIINGVNTQIFYPDPARIFNKDHVHFCTTGNIRNIDMLDPVVRALDLLQEDIKFTFHVVGPVKNEACAALMNRDYIVHHGNCDLHKVSDILRNSDIFIYSHLNPPCPNSVLEAIASGLPVVGFHSGAMAELLPFSSHLLADAGQKLYQSFQDFFPKLLAAKILQAVNEYPDCRASSLQAWESTSMDKCGSQYVAVLENLMERADR